MKTPDQIAAEAAEERREYSYTCQADYDAKQKASERHRHHQSRHQTRLHHR